MGDETLYELTKRFIPITKITGTTISWRDSVIAVVTDKGMHFLDFSLKLDYLYKEINVLDHSIPSPKTSPAVSLCKSKFISNEMKNYDYTEMLLDSSFWPHNKSLMEEMTRVVMCAWSPPNFIDNKSVISVLNNIGGVEMLIQQQYQWKSILNLSTYANEILEYNTSPKTFEELKNSVYKVETCSICWAPTLGNDGACYFMTAQKDGTILFWLISPSAPPKLMDKIESCLNEIRNMLWVHQTDTTFWLICCDSLGQVKVFDTQIENGVLSVLQTEMLWNFKDRMIASCLNYKTVDDKVILLYAKHRHLVVQVINKNCKLVTQHVQNINDYRITDITDTANGYYISTINVNIYQLKINLSGDNLNVELIPIILKESYSTSELYGIRFSNTTTLCVLAMIDRKLLCRKEVSKIDVVFLSSQSKFNSIMPLIINSPTKKLTEYWDCIEALRYNILKTRTMPELDYNSLYKEGVTDIYKLKIYLFLLHFFINIRKTARISNDFTLPELSVNKIKENILFLHAQSNLENLYKKYKKNVKVSRFEKESLFGSVNYLEYYLKHYKSEVTIDKDKLVFAKKNKFEYTCQGCNSKISESLLCKSGHLNMYCMISFVPITDDDYLFCKCCEGTARSDLKTNNPLCVFCDQMLDKPD